MTRGKAEDAGGLTPAKDDNAAPYHFDRRSLPIFKCVDYKHHRYNLPSYSKGQIKSKIEYRPEGDAGGTGGAPPAAFWYLFRRRKRYRRVRGRAGPACCHCRRGQPHYILNV